MTDLLSKCPQTNICSATDGKNLWNLSIIRFVTGTEWKCACSYITLLKWMCGCFFTFVHLPSCTRHALNPICPCGSGGCDFCPLWFWQWELGGRHSVQTMEPVDIFIFRNIRSNAFNYNCCVSGGFIFKNIKGLWWISFFFNYQRYKNICKHTSALKFIWRIRK